MSACVIFGGAGFVGTHLTRHFLQTDRFSEICIADTRPSPLQGAAQVKALSIDVRRPIAESLSAAAPEWIFNLAAVHREPGHEPHEYFDTNLQGAANVCDYARRVQCDKLYFTSSISVYGRTQGPTDEAAPICPNSAYGASKYPAEWIHRAWLAANDQRRLVICRPGVLYGPGDPGNILRMVRAIKRGYFVFPGSADIHKSYGYIYGLIDSIDFAMAREEPLIIYNYVEHPTEPLGGLVEHIKQHLSSRAPVLHLPLPLLMPLATAVTGVLGSRSPVHPTRVRKAAMSTHIVPAWLADNAFKFRFPFTESLRHWSAIAPEDFR